MTTFPTPRYYKRRENNGFWTVVPLQGPFAADSVMVNDFTCRTLELLESGNTLVEVLDVFKREYPQQDEQKLRIDLFHVASRLKKYDLVEAGGFTGNVAILKNGRGLVREALQPCPLAHIPELSRLFLDACGEGDSTWLYNLYAKGVRETTTRDIPTCLYDAERMTEAQATGEEIFWVYADEHARAVGGISSSNYMLMIPVVTLTGLAVRANPSNATTLPVAMLSQLSEILSIFALNQKVRIMSCPSANNPAHNLTVPKPELFSVLGLCRYKRSASFPREIAGEYDVEYFDCTP